MSDDNLTNQALGDALGVTHAQASRYRSGHRVPNDLTMLKVSRLMDWPIEDQIAKKHEQLKKGQPDHEGAYAAEFRRREPIAMHRLGLAAQQALEQGGDDE